MQIFRRYWILERCAHLITDTNISDIVGVDWYFYPTFLLLAVVHNHDGIHLQMYPSLVSPALSNDFRSAVAQKEKKKEEDLLTRDS